MLKLGLSLVAMTVAASVQAKTLVYCSEGSPEGFNPQLFTSGTTYDASSVPLYNRLVEFKIGTTEVIPGLAEKWEVSEDGKTIVLSYVNPSELPDVLNDPVEYRDYILRRYYTDDFDLSSKLFINEGDVVLRAANYEDEGVREYDYVLEIDGVEYILEYQGG